LSASDQRLHHWHLSSEHLAAPLKPLRQRLKLAPVGSTTVAIGQGEEGFDPTLSLVAPFQSHEGDCQAVYPISELQLLNVFHLATKF
jgi:hypothetical protein